MTQRHVTIGHRDAISKAVRGSYERLGIKADCEQCRAEFVKRAPRQRFCDPCGIHRGSIHRDRYRLRKGLG